VLGVSFRPRQVEAFGLDGPATLRSLLAHPFQIIRLGAYWNRMETSQGGFDTSELDWQLDAAERAGKQVILALGAVKNFGYPEVFIPRHYEAEPLREGRLVTPLTHPRLLGGATSHIAKLVNRYRDRQSIVAWQLEHEAVDPLGVEHSWRLSLSFVERELEALRAADSARPVMMNGFLPNSPLVRLSQWWRTRDQGDSRAAAVQLADIVGIDDYPRTALRRFGQTTLYVEGTNRPREALVRRLWMSARARRKRVMVAEGQAEPWEAVTVPPNPSGRAAFSCPPVQLIRNYNTALTWLPPGDSLYAYLFWGAEYWILREKSGDPSYLRTFARILDNAGTRPSEAVQA
jgi:hypothetical protein